MTITVQPTCGICISIEMNTASIIMLAVRIDRRHRVGVTGKISACRSPGQPSGSLVLSTAVAMLHPHAMPGGRRGRRRHLQLPMPAPAGAGERWWRLPLLRPTRGGFDEATTRTRSVPTISRSLVIN